MLGAYIQEKRGRKVTVIGSREHWTHGYCPQKIHTLWISCGKSKMKFRPGNLLKNNANRGLWLVVGVVPIDKRAGSNRRFRMRLDAVCVQPGISKINFPGSTDSWFFREPDGSDKSHGWTVINEV